MLGSGNRNLQALGACNLLKEDKRGLVKKFSHIQGAKNSQNKRDRGRREGTPSGRSECSSKEMARTGPPGSPGQSPSGGDPREYN